MDDILVKLSIRFRGRVEVFSLRVVDGEKISTGSTQVTWCLVNSFQMYVI